MRKLVLLVFFLQTGNQLVQSQTLFTKTYGAFGEFNVGQSVVNSKDSAYVFLGSTGGWGAQNGDMALVKTDSLGNTLWQRIYGNANTEQGISVKLTNDAGFILAGITNEGDAGDYNIRVIRVDSSGNLIWEKTLGSSAWEIVEEVIALMDGGFALAATSFEEPYSSGTFYLIKLDADGNIVWENKFPNGSNNKVGGIDELADGSILAGGAGKQLGHSDSDMLLVKYTSEGQIIWENYYGDLQNETVSDITHSPENRICLAGNKTQIEGNTREIIVLVDSLGALTNISDFNSARMIDVKSVCYSASDNSFTIGADHISDIETRASIYKFDNLLNFVCYASANSLKNSYIGEALLTTDGHFLLNGTYNFLAPGLSSFFLMKTSVNCEANLNVIIGIEEQKVEVINNLLAFPNPSSGELKLRMNKSPDFIQLIDVMGKQVPIYTNFEEGLLEIKPKQFLSGMFILSIRENPDSEIINQSIFIQR